MNPFHLTDKTAIITGGGSGIGESIATTFAENGAEVHILDISVEGAQRVVEKIKEKGGSALSYQCNISSQAEVLKIVDQIAERSSIDILVNNAGVAHVGNVEQTTEKDLDRLYEVNIKGVYNCLYACIPHMKKNGGGVILNIASVASSVGISDRFAYSMTKGAVLTMTYQVAKDYLEYNIRCNSVSPGRVHTPFVDGYLAKNYPGREKELYDQLAATQPIGRMGKPEEVAMLALFLCSDQAGFITGTDYPIDGGFLKLNT